MKNILFGALVAGSFSQSGAAPSASPSGRDSVEGSMFFNWVPVALAWTNSLPQESLVPNLPELPDPVWQTKLGAPVYAAAALRDGIAYVGTSGGLFHAIEASNGTFVSAGPLPLAERFTVRPATGAKVRVDCSQRQIQWADEFIPNVAR